MSRFKAPAPLAHVFDPSIRAALPKHLFEENEFDFSFPKRVFMTAVQGLIQGGIRLALRPRGGAVGGLTKEEVDAVYSREARTYDFKHHLTTRGQDTIWRRTAGEVIVNTLSKTDRLEVLDLCTGTGLTVAEADRVLAANYSREDTSVSIVGLDFNAAMLEQARSSRVKRFQFFHPVDVQFVQGDATALTYGAGTFDLVTQVFGIGGINTPVAVFNETLRTLRDQGQFLLIDMHRPILNLPGEYSVFGMLKHMPALEMLTYERTTIPLALNRLWGWRDTTLDFYLAPLVSRRESDGTYSGFEVVFRHFEPERWWLSMPVMPTMRLLLRKQKISPEEARSRQELLDSIGRFIR